jgi:archaellum component FlaF (FlaF/FlaG flagellin family)
VPISTLFRSFVPSLLGLLVAPLALLTAGSAHAVDVNADCAALYGASFNPVIGQVAAPTPGGARPAKGVPFKDPAFGTCVVRATDHAVEPPSGFARNDYSRRQAFNANNTRVLVYSLNGAWHLYDANSLLPLRVLNGPAGDAEPQWDPTDPQSLFWIPINGGMVLNKLNVETNTSTTAANFAGKLPWADVARVWTKSEGSASADGRYWCFMAETSAFGIRGVFTYDLQTQTVLGTRSLSSRPDHISMSASGRWCTISGGDVSGATMAWNRTFTQSVQLHQGGEHSDLALGADGHDYYVAVDYQSNAGDMYMLDIDTGVKTVLFPTYIAGTATAYHISGKAFAKPGWVLVSTYARSGAEKWLHERVMAVELAAAPKIINIAHHHTSYNGYWTEPHASVSRDFSHVFFSSNWATTSDTDVDAFMVRLPDNLFSTSPPPVDTIAPTATAGVSGTSGTISLTATASDNVGVSRVDFLVDGIIKGSDATSPYALSLDSTTLSNASHTLVTKAYDAVGNVGTSASVGFSVNNVIADITAPSVTASVTGSSGTITLAANANDNVGVARVDFLVDGVVKGSDATSPYALSLDSTTLSNAAHLLIANAYDAAGNVGSSIAVSFTVANTVADTSAPTATASVTGSSGTITLNASASDNLGVAKVEFLVDGTLKGSDTSSPYALPLDSNTLVNGNHTLVAKAYDAAGNVGNSAAVTFAIDNFALDPNDSYLWMVPPASNAQQQGFVRLLNLENRASEVMVWGLDSKGHRSAGTITLTLAPHEARQFNSQDLEAGNTAKGLIGSIGSGDGNWTVVIRTDLDIEPLAYIRTPDGFLTAMHDRVNGDGIDWLVPIFNPADNPNQVSRLRVVNTNAQPVGIQIVGRDDSGQLGQSAVSVTLAPLASLEMSSVDLENGNAALGLAGTLGNGVGKWQLTLAATAPVTVQSLLFDPLGKLTNLSTVADLSQPIPGERVLWMVPPASNTQQQGFVRLVNLESRSGDVQVWGVDDSGRRSTGTISMTLAPNESRQFNSQDIENGNASKGLSGSLGTGTGNWRLVLQSDLNLLPMALIRTPDGFLTTIHDIVASSGTVTPVPTFNPADNPNQVSVLRLINPNPVAVALTIQGIDDTGASAPVGAVSLTLPAESAIDLSSVDLEGGNTSKGLGGKLGNGSGKWALTVNATAPIKAMSLLRDPKGFLTNLSTASKATSSTLQ